MQITRKTAYALAVVVSLSATQAWADGIIKGRIVDNNNQPMPGTTVSVGTTGRTAISDSRGTFTLTGVPAGTHAVTVSGMGFETTSSEVTVVDNKTASADFKVQAGISKMSKMTVTGYLQGQTKALNTQKTNENITNVISSDQVGKFPDANVGDAMKRIAGVNVQYDQGEARFGNIRGTAPQYNSVTINGERIPSAEAEDRTVQLDLVPADMIQSMEVSKAITPDMDGDAIGGSVNLVTRAAPYDRRISLTAGSGVNFLAKKPIITGAAVFGDRFFKDKLGLILSGSYNNHMFGSDNMEAAWNYSDETAKDASAFTEEFQIRQYELQRIRQSYSAALDFKFNENHSILLSGIYNWRNDWENRYRTVFTGIEQDDDGVWIGEIRKETKGGNGDTKNRRLEAQRMMQFGFGGDHQFGKLSVDWDASMAQASEERPNERYMSYRQKDVPVTLNASSKESPQVSAGGKEDFSADFGLKEITESFGFTEDVDQNFKLNLLLPLLDNKFENSLKAGFRYKGKTKMRDNKTFEYAPLEDAEDAFDATTLDNLVDKTKDDFLAGDYKTGKQIKETYLGDLNLKDATLFEEERILEDEAGNFDATERVVAGYLMLNQNLGEKFSLVAGARAERTDQEYQGFTYDADEDLLTKTAKVSDDYMNILPSVHLKMKATPATILRAAWTNTIARPNYFSLVPYRQIAREDNEISIGNPDLTPTESMNLDFMAEHYFQSIGMVSAGLFYKDISGFIVDEKRDNFLFEGNEWSTYTRPINGGNATLFGLELAAQRQLDFLPGALAGFGLYANYTHTKSEISDFQIEGRDKEELALPGSPKHTVNGSISYDWKKVSTRVSLNYASAFVEEFGEEKFFDIYYDQAMQLDVNGSFAVTPKLRIYADALNLLNQPLRYYQGVEERTYQAEYYNVKLNAGVKLDL